MQFTETGVQGAFVIDLRRIVDERGFFARQWCHDELAKRGLCAHIAQINTSESTLRGTVRGMHYQETPHAEVKIAHCPRGAVFDVVVDLRPDSPTFRRWHGVELTGENFRALYVPEGCAHGFITLRDDTVLTYFTSKPYAPAAAKGVRFDDPAFGIRWPEEVRVVSAADRQWPVFPNGSQQA
ncbi:MAG: dTDP-4-dehydrorhamnose 3,5-epimerase family protein [Gammaproteobacteria bacterium]